MQVSNITKGAIISYIAIFVNIAITFFYTPWMIRQIGVSNYGLYTLILAFMSYFLLDFGLSSSIARFISKYRAEGDEVRVANMLGLTTKVYLIIDIIIFLVLFITFFFIRGIFKGLTADEIAILKILYIIAGTFSVLSFVFKPMDGAMMAYEYFVENKTMDLVQKVGTVLLVVLALCFNGDVYSLVFINGFVAFAVSVSKFLIFKYKSQLKINWNFFDRTDLKILFSFSTWIFLVNLAQRFRLTLVPSVLGIEADSTEVAIFSMGISLEGLFWLVSYALTGLFLPKVTRLSMNKDIIQIQNLMIRVGRIQLIILFFIYSGFLLFGDFFLKLWVSKEFADVYFVFLLLTLPYPIILTQTIAQDLVFAENKVKYTASMTFITSLVGLLFCFFSAKEFGAVGCAFCTCCGQLCYMIAVNIFYKRNLGLDVLVFFKDCHIKVLSPLLISLCIGALIKFFFHCNSWVQFGGCIVLYSLIYFANSYFLVFRKDEKALIKKLILQK